MTTQICWINENGYPAIGIMPRPRGGEWLEEEIGSLKCQGANVLVSLPMEEEVEELGLKDEANFCSKAGVEFISFPIPDRGVPPLDDKFNHLLHSLIERLAQGRAVAVHCRAGIGRAGLLAMCLLVLHDKPLDLAVSVLSNARGFPVPDTDEQLNWAADFGKLYEGKKGL